MDYDTLGPFAAESPHMTRLAEMLLADDNDDRRTVSRAVMAVLIGAEIHEGTSLDAIANTIAALLVDKVDFHRRAHC